MSKGKLHFIINDSIKKTACGIDKERVETTTYAEIVNCRKCKWAKVFWKGK